MEWTDSQRAALADLIRERVKAQTEHFSRIKIALIGFLGVGKTCLAHRLAWGEYCDRDQLPLDQACDMEYTKAVKVQGSTHYLILDRYHDLSGYVEFSEDTARYIVNNYDACIFMHTVCDRYTFERMQKIYHTTVNMITQSKPLLFVAAGKADIEPWEVPLEQVEEFSRSIDAKLLITSSKTGRGLGEDDATTLADYILHTKAMEREQKLNQQAEQAVANEPLKAPRRCSVLRKVVRVITGGEQQ